MGVLGFRPRGPAWGRWPRFSSRPTPHPCGLALFMALGAENQGRAAVFPLAAQVGHAPADLGTGEGSVLGERRVGTAFPAWLWGLQVVQEPWVLGCASAQRPVWVPAEEPVRSSTCGSGQQRVSLWRFGCGQDGWLFFAFFSTWGSF